MLKKFYARPARGASGDRSATRWSRRSRFQPNHDFLRDMFNVAVGIVWQLCLVTLPIYIVLQQWSWAAPVAATPLATSIVLKLTWFDRLEINEA